MFPKEVHRARKAYEKSLKKWERKLSRRSIPSLGKLPVKPFGELPVHEFGESRGKRIIMEPLRYTAGTNAYQL